MSRSHKVILEYKPFRQQGCSPQSYEGGHQARGFLLSKSRAALRQCRALLSCPYMLLGGCLNIESKKYFKVIEIEGREWWFTDIELLPFHNIYVDKILLLDEPIYLHRLRRDFVSCQCHQILSKMMTGAANIITFGTMYSACRLQRKAVTSVFYELFRYRNNTQCIFNEIGLKFIKEQCHLLWLEWAIYNSVTTCLKKT